nr:MAG TPA_asm: hypothetical protein [Caudoviricetes sp.]
MVMDFSCIMTLLAERSMRPSASAIASSWR